MATIFRSIEQIYQTSLQRWRECRGKGTISYDSYLDLTKPAVYIINKYLEANPNDHIVIIVPNTTRANIWQVNISVGMKNPETFNAQVRILHIDEILQQHIKDEVELLIVDFIELYTDHYREEVLKGTYIKFKYCMGLTHSVMPEKQHFVAYDNFGVIHKVTKLDLITSGLLSNVQEFMIGADMDTEDRGTYEMYTQFINDTFEMYGDFTLINSCYIGDPKSGISPDTFRQQLARERGWSKELDLDNQYNLSIDRYFAPANIYERCKTCIEYFQERKRLMSDNDAKIGTVIDLLRNHRDKKVLIINKRSDFATKLTNAINKEFGNKDDNKPASNLPLVINDGILMSYRTNHPSVAVEYHLDIASRPMKDPNTGQLMKIKSGENKGQVKQLGAKSISNINLEQFNNDPHGVLCTNNTLIKDLQTTIDFIIVTSVFCNPVEMQQYRVKRLDFIGNPTIINVYLNDTKESSTLNANIVKSKHNVKFCSVDEVLI